MAIIVPYLVHIHLHCMQLSQIEYSAMYFSHIQSAVSMNPLLRTELMSIPEYMIQLCSTYSLSVLLSVSQLHNTTALALALAQ